MNFNGIDFFGSCRYTELFMATELEQRKSLKKMGVCVY